MEEKVQNVLHLLQEDGDSFAKRAEMYYKRRPELINFVEETYRAYRALAERYEKISTDLQNANTTIASVFPEQVQFSMDDDEDDGSVPHFKSIGKHSEEHKPSIPKVPAPPKKNLKSLLTTATKKLQSNKASQKFRKIPAKSGLTEGQAVGEIDKLQKEILTLQTEKEFVKSSYENKLGRYWDIDREISEMQEKISGLQDEFNVGSIIEDDEARTLMASTALKSCQDTLISLEEKHEQSAEEAKSENQKINDARSKLENLRNEMNPDNCSQQQPSGLLNTLNPEGFFGSDQSKVESKHQLKNDEFNGSLSMTDMAEKIDELVQKVISLETDFSSQSAHVKRLRTEADELQKQVLSLEADKAALIDGTESLTKKLQEMEGKTLEVLDSDSNSYTDDNPFLSNGIPSQLESLDGAHIHGETTKEGDNEHSSFYSQTHDQSSCMGTATEDHVEKLKEPFDATIKPDKKSDNEVPALENSKQEEALQSQVKQSPKSFEAAEGVIASELEANHTDTSLQTKKATDEDEPNWQELFMNGLQDKEKVILKEYTNTLRNYKDLKKKLTEVEKKNNDTLLEFVTQIRELRSAVSKKDEEIQSLRQKLTFLKDHKDLEEQPISDLADGKTSKVKDESVEPQTLQTPQSSDVPADQDNADNDQVLREILSCKNLVLSPIEEKFRSNIDELLEENLNFWLRFSSSFHQIQKFQTEVEDLHAELAKTEEKKTKKQDGSSSKHRNLKSDVVPIYKHLSEINAEISVWLDQSVQLKEELQSRFSSLCNIQDEISEALVAACGEIEEAMFTSYQAAKFQGEILNMKQENNKVDDELQSAIEHATRVQLEIEKTLGKLDEDYKISETKNNRTSQPQLTHSDSRNRVPLQAFIFGVKPKKQRYSIFSVMHPAMLKKHYEAKTGS